MRRGLLIVIGLLTVLVMAAGCREDDAVLSKLLGDPMAGRSQPGASLALADDISARKGGIFGKPRYTKVLRSFAPQGQSAADLRRQLVASAEASGWIFQQGPNRRQGTKQLDFGRATISIDVNPYVSPVQVSVVLEPAG